MKSSLTLQQLSEFLSEYWELIKKSHTADLSWEGLKQETDRLDEKYPGRYYRDMMIALVSEFERTQNGGKDKG